MICVFDYHVCIPVSVITISLPSVCVYAGLHVRVWLWCVCLCMCVFVFVVMFVNAHVSECVFIIVHT